MRIWEKIEQVLSGGRGRSGEERREMWRALSFQLRALSGFKTAFYGDMAARELAEEEDCEAARASFKRGIDTLLLDRDNEEEEEKRRAVREWMHDPGDADAALAAVLCSAI